VTDNAGAGPTRRARRTNSLRATTYDNNTWKLERERVLNLRPLVRWRAPRAAALRVYVRVSFTA